MSWQTIAIVLGSILYFLCWMGLSRWTYRLDDTPKDDAELAICLLLGLFWPLVLVLSTLVWIVESGAKKKEKR